MSGTHQRRSRARLAESAITIWALLGGVVLVAVVLMNTYSVIGNNFGAPFPGDFEMTEMGVCIAAFAFLPYCQLTGSNVTADIFTSRTGPRWMRFGRRSSTGMMRPSPGRWTVSVLLRWCSSSAILLARCRARKPFMTTR